MKPILLVKGWRPPSTVFLVFLCLVAGGRASLASRRPAPSLHPPAFFVPNSRTKGRSPIVPLSSAVTQEPLVFQGKSVAETMKEWQETTAAVASTRGGELMAVKRFTLSSFWGILGVVAVVGNALRRLLPIAMEPFKVGNFTPLLWAQYVGFALFMAYAEGFKGFQKKFSPLVVRRAYTLGPNSPFLHKLLAPFYSMGFIHSSKKRKIISWSLTLGVAVLIKLVKTLTYPYRSIIDAGVVVGLSWGLLATAGIYLRTLVTRKIPDVDPAFPEVAKKA